MNTTEITRETFAHPTASTPARRTARSALAVFAGLASTFAVTTAADLVLHATGVYPAFGVRMADGLFVLALAYRIPFNVAGSWLAARLAPARPRAHALALGVIGVLLSIVGAITMGKYGPVWYSVANVVIALPCAYAGARLLRRA